MAPLIYPNSREDARVLARQLLDAASPDRHDEVRTTSDGPLGLAFDVPDDLAQEAAGGYEVVDLKEDEGDGETPTPEPDREPEPEPEPKPEPEPEPKPAGEPEPEPVNAGEKSTSADAGADVSEVDAKTDGASQPPSKASRSRSPRSR
ncbi:hypothetical protein GA0070610_1751 [Micromonospora echinofusca]|uniref:Uncharacterized protein n=1 Tax=Micromonospora echinofusca TaxID=47858 RepID=A0A1C5G735_MICEH|nr:hypothetical protein [Micromonospora echinofusca]SCG15517.1 hypothetical protein GA0070610_1751 [Micromonospora echinofusca]